MALQYMENFSNYGAGEAGVANMLDNLPWIAIQSTSIQLPVDPDGLSGGRVFRLRSNLSNNYVGDDNRLALSNPEKVLGVAARFWFASLPVSAAYGSGIINFATTGNGIMYQLRVEPNGALSIYKAASVGSNPATLVATTTVPVIGTGAWNHIEMKVNTTTGDIEVRKEGAVIAALDVTASAPYDLDVGIVIFSIRSADGASVGAIYMKDLIIWDATGSVNNDFTGPCTVYTLQVDGDVSSGWTPSTGSSDFDLLDKTTPDDTTFISADDTPPAPSIMTFGNLPADVVSVRGLQTVVRMQKSDGGDATVQVSLTSGGMDDAGADRAITTTFAYWLDISELDPDTAAPWTPIAVNDADIKINRTT